MRLAGFRSYLMSEAIVLFCSFIRSWGLWKRFLSPRRKWSGDGRAAGGPGYLCHCHPQQLEVSLDTECWRSPTSTHGPDVFWREEKLVISESTKTWPPLSQRPSSSPRPMKELILGRGSPQNLKISKHKLWKGSSCLGTSWKPGRHGS